LRGEYVRYGELIALGQWDSNRSQSRITLEPTTANVVVGYDSGNRVKLYTMSSVSWVHKLPNTPQETSLSRLRLSRAAPVRGSRFQSTLPLMLLPSLAAAESIRGNRRVVLASA
jgi:hypothetical protein